MSGAVFDNLNVVHRREKTMYKSFRKHVAIVLVVLLTLLPLSVNAFAGEEKIQKNITVSVQNTTNQWGRWIYQRSTSGNMWIDELRLTVVQSIFATALGNLGWLFLPQTIIKFFKGFDSANVYYKMDIYVRTDQSNPLIQEYKYVVYCYADAAHTRYIGTETKYQIYDYTHRIEDPEVEK